MDKRILFFSLIFISLFTGVMVYFQDSAKNYDSVVIFRNDDVSTVNNELREFNDIFESRGIPVTHSVVPKQVIASNNSDSICNRFREIENENINYAIHGYNHNGSEFKNSDWDNINEKIVNIDSFSQECFGYRPDIFVAPQNAMSSDARILLNQSNFNVISADRKMAWQTGDVKVIENRTEYLNARPLELGQSSMMVDNWDKNPVKFRNLSSLKNDFDKSVAESEIHVQTVHYSPLMRNNQSGDLEALIKYMESEKVYFTSFDNLIQLFQDGKIEFNGDRWRIKE